MATVRLTKELEAKIENVSQNEHITKSDIIKQALESYLAVYYCEKTPYELGKHLFGKHGSGKKDGSTGYKKLIKGKIGEKRHR